MKVYIDTIELKPKNYTKLSSELCYTENCYTPYFNNEIIISYEGDSSKYNIKLCEPCLNKLKNNEELICSRYDIL